MARPVLMFHSVAPGPGAHDIAYNISPSRFWRAINLTRRLGLVTTDLQVPPGPDRQTIITFDDGYLDLYTEVFPRFQDLGLKAVAFVVVERLSQAMDWNPAIRKKLISANQMQEMHRYGFRFGSHTLTHCNLAEAAPGTVRKEVADSKARLEDILGGAVEMFSYPWGRVNERARAAVAEAGYRCAVTTESRLNRSSDDPFLIPRLTVSELDTPLGLASKLLTGRDYRQMTPAHAWRWCRRRLARA